MTDSRKPLFLCPCSRLTGRAARYAWLGAMRPAGRAGGGRRARLAHMRDACLVQLRIRRALLPGCARARGGALPARPHTVMGQRVCPRGMMRWVVVMLCVDLGACASQSAPPRRPGAAKLPPMECALGQRRISCATAKLDAPPVSTPSSFIIDGPYIGNGNLGAALSADHGLQFWLGANNMWST